jgi:hypothetical protein
MIHHQNADAMGLIQCAYARHYPSGRRHFEYFQGGECLSNAHWLGPCRQHFDDEFIINLYGYAKIIEGLC